MDIALQEFEKAAERLKPILHHTEMDLSSTFSRMTGGRIYLKCENRQKTGSFKIRGASNKIASLVEQGRTSPVVAASAGNHAQGVAYSSSRLGLQSTIFMPTFTPPLKVLATRSYGANVVLSGDSFDDAFAASQEYCKEHNATYIHPFNDPLVIAGQGVVGLEIFAQLPEVDVVLVPIGGGGLISGMAIALKEMNPNIKVIGVEAEQAASMFESRRNKRIVALNQVNTIADGIAVKRPGDLTFNVIQRYVDDIVKVSEAEIAHATYLLLQRGKLLAEPSGVTGLAAAISGRCSIEGKNVVPVISGGNINMSLLEQIVEQGMTQEGLRATIRVVIPDQAGQLRRIIGVLERLKANIQDITHNRSTSNVTVGHVLTQFTINLQDKAQLDIIAHELAEIGLPCEVAQ